MNTGDIAWILLASALVLLMTPGLALFYGGLSRSKNAAGTIMHSFMCMGIVGVVWVLWGYSLAFGPDVGSFIGDFSFLGLSGVSASLPGPYADNMPHQTFMIFQGMFAIITPALVTGAFAERMKFSTFVIFIVLWVTIVYAPVAHWVWGGGWLGELGALDFAGGSVVHINSGVAALAAAIIFGKRLGFGSEAMEPHNVPMVVLGAGLLWFGWFGFNAGSALAADGTAVNAFVVTNTAAAAGILGWTAMSWILDKKPSVIGAASGAVAGLVAITPAAGFVGPMPSILIGLVGGNPLLPGSRTPGQAEPGRLAVGMGRSRNRRDMGGAGDRAVRRNRFRRAGCRCHQGRAGSDQVIAIVATWAWAFAVTAIILWALKATIGLRVSDNDEAVGLDEAEHGEPAYRL